SHGVSPGGYEVAPRPRAQLYPDPEALATASFARSAEKPLDHVARDLRDVLIHRQRVRVADRADREDRAAAGRLVVDDLRPAVVGVEALGQEPGPLRRAGGHLVGLVARGAAGAAHVQAL